MFAFLLALNGAVLATPDSAERSFCLIRTGGLFLAFVLSILLVRGRLLKRSWVAALVYRIGIYGVVQVSYFFLKHVLPLVNTTRWIKSCTSSICGCSTTSRRWPGIATSTPATTDWFAFFYFGYFLLMAVHVVPLVFFGRQKQIVGEFTFGILLMFSIGHSLYMVVPGYGPYRAMADAFQHPFPDGLWYRMTMDAVRSSGALMDIFPSLHTGAPTVLALFSYRNRKHMPYRYTWPIVTFCTANIIIATMFLRWHYLIDVVAGFSIAVSVVLLSRPIVRWELARRRREGLGELWPEFSNAPLSGSGSKDLADGVAAA